MLSISERTNLVDTIDTLSQLEESGESIVALLGRVREAHPSAHWRILYVERLGDAEDAGPGPSPVEALVELTIGNLSRKNFGESATNEVGNPLLAAVTNALVPMLLVALAAIEEADEIARADRERFM